MSNVAHFSFPPPNDFSSKMLKSLVAKLYFWLQHLDEDNDGTKSFLCTTFKWEPDVQADGTWDMAEPTLVIFSPVKNVEDFMVWWNGKTEDSESNIMINVSNFDITKSLDTFVQLEKTCFNVLEKLETEKCERESAQRLAEDLVKARQTVAKSPHE